MAFAAAGKVGIYDSSFEWAKVDLGALLKDDPISITTAEQGIAALLYTPATEFNAIHICEKGVFGLQSQVQVKLQAELAVAKDADEAAARVAAVRIKYIGDLTKCVQEAAQHENVRVALNAALASAKASNIVVDSAEALELQKKALEGLIAQYSDNAAQRERITADIQNIDTLIAAHKEGGNSASSDSFKNALAALNAARSEQVATLAPATELIAQPANGAEREKPHEAAATEPKEDTVLSLLDELSEAEDSNNKRRILEAEPDSAARSAVEQASTTTQLLAEKVEIKAKEKWGVHRHHRHHTHVPQIGSSARQAKTAAFMASSSYKDENTIRGYMASPVQGEKWELVKFYSGPTDVQRFIAKSGTKAVVAFRGSGSGSDWWANLRMWNCPWGPGQVHCGFLSQFTDQQTDLDLQLDKLVHTEGVKNILITGHSLGGALSWLATYYIRAKYPVTKYPSVTVEVISFAAPSPADSAFMTWINNNVVHHNHIVYGMDVVPCVPPGYPEPSQIRHYTQEWQTWWWGWWTWFDSRKHYCATCLSVGDHSMSGYCRAVGLGGSAGECPAAF